MNQTNTAECPSQQQLQGYLLGECDGTTGEQIESHLESCENCNAAASHLEEAEDTLIGSLKDADTQPEVEQPEVVYALHRSKQLWGKHSRERSDSQKTHPGSIGEYDILNSLGEGGMATVYLAEHRRLRQKVAIKLLPNRLFADPVYAQRFTRETQAIGQLNHPSIVKATDAGQTDECHFLVMEYVDGANLSQIARNCDRLDEATVCAIGYAVAAALSHSHQLGIVHRDIKPSNIMLCKTGEVKLLDFGLARHALWSSEQAELTTVGQLMGTLDYMAPEQAEKAAAVDYRADLYSLGATMYRLMAGRPPLMATPDLSPLEKLKLLATAEPPLLRSLNPDVSPEIESIVMELLARNVEQRPASAAHVMDRLAPLSEPADLSKLASVVIPTREDIRHLPDPAAEPRLVVSTKGSFRDRFAWRWIAAAVMFAGFIAGIVFAIDTQKGQLVIDSQVPVTLKLRDAKGTEREVSVKTGATKTKLFAGSYELELDSASDQVTLDQNQIEIRRGEVVIARVDRVDMDADATSPLGIAPLSSNPIAEPETKLFSSDQRLQPGVVLELRFPQATSMNGTYPIDSEGKIKLPLIGVVNAENRTLSELEAVVNSELHLRNYYKQPDAEFYFAKDQRQGHLPTHQSPLVPGDHLKWTINRNYFEFSECVVLGDNTIKLPHIGVVSTAGLNILQLEERVDEAYQAYYREPAVEFFFVPSVPRREPQSNQSTASAFGPRIERNPSELEPTYDGSNLDYWLMTLKRERSYKRINEAFQAIQQLRDAKQNEKIREALLEWLMREDRPASFKAAALGLRDTFENEGAFQATIRSLANDQPLEKRRWVADILFKVSEPNQETRDWIIENFINHQVPADLAYDFGMQLYRPMVTGTMADEECHEMIARIDAKIEERDVFWIELQRRVYHASRVVDSDWFQIENRVQGNGLEIFLERYYAAIKEALTNPSADAGLQRTALEQLARGVRQGHTGTIEKRIEDAIQLETLLQAYAYRVLVDERRGFEQLARVGGITSVGDTLFVSFSTKIWTLFHAFNNASYSRKISLFADADSLGDALNQTYDFLIEKNGLPTSWAAFPSRRVGVSITDQDLESDASQNVYGFLLGAFYYSNSENNTFHSDFAKYALAKAISNDFPSLLGDANASVPMQEVEAHWWSRTSRRRSIDQDGDGTVTNAEAIKYLDVIFDEFVAPSFRSTLPR